MCIPFCYPNLPLLHRKLPDLGFDRIFLHLVILQFLVQCLHYENNASRRELVDFCKENWDMCLWERVFRTE